MNSTASRELIAFNTYKPFACGIVIHLYIDGCVQLALANQLVADDIERIELKVHPLVLELTGKTAPRTGLEGKFSVYPVLSSARAATLLEQCAALGARTDLRAFAAQTH